MRRIPRAPDAPPAPEPQVDDFKDTQAERPVVAIERAAEAMERAAERIATEVAAAAAKEPLTKPTRFSVTVTGHDEKGRIKTFDIEVKA